MPGTGVSADEGLPSEIDKDKNVLWSVDTPPGSSSPIVVDGRLYIGSNNGNLYTLDADTGAELWRVEVGGPVVSSPAVAFEEWDAQEARGGWGAQSEQEQEVQKMGLPEWKADFARLELGPTFLEPTGRRIQLGGIRRPG